MRVMLLVFDDDVLRLECWLHEMSIEFTVQVIMLGLGLDAHMCSSVTNQHDFWAQSMLWSHFSTWTDIV